MSGDEKDLLAIGTYVERVVPRENTHTNYSPSGNIRGGIEHKTFDDVEKTGASSSKLLKK